MNKSRENLTELFLDKIITEKNLSKASVNSYSSDLKMLNSFLEALEPISIPYPPDP